MGKRKRNGLRSGYTEYRYGTKKKPVTLPNIFKGQVREAMIGMVGEHLGGWWRSPFQREGNSIAFIRSSLCLSGYSFPQSEHEAFALVREALRRNRARRPTWDEGQREYTTPKECCVQCGGELPEDSSIGLRNRVFCSVACAQSCFRMKDDDRPIKENPFRLKAYRMLYAAKCQPRDCQQCAVAFQPKFENSDQVYCSRVCRAQSRRTLQDRTCAACGKTYRPTQASRQIIYCSNECFHKGGFTLKYERTCGWCGVQFMGKVPRAAYCSPDHSWRAYQAKKRGKVTATNVIYLTPELFDRMFPTDRYQVTLDSRLFDKMFGANDDQQETARDALDRLFA